MENVNGEVKHRRMAWTARSEAIETSSIIEYLVLGGTPTSRKLWPGALALEGGDGASIAIVPVLELRAEACATPVESALVRSK